MISKKGEIKTSIRRRGRQKSEIWQHFPALNGDTWCRFCLKKISSRAGRLKKHFDGCEKKPNLKGIISERICCSISSYSMVTGTATKNDESKQDYQSDLNEDPAPRSNYIEVNNDGSNQDLNSIFIAVGEAVEGTKLDLDFAANSNSIGDEIKKNESVEKYKLHLNGYLDPSLTSISDAAINDRPVQASQFDLLEDLIPNSHFISNDRSEQKTHFENTETTFTKLSPCPRGDIKIGCGNDIKWNIGLGINNFGNTCYVNATLQALFYIPSLANWLQSDLNHRKRCRLPEECTLCLVAEIFKHTQHTKSLTPNDLYANILKIYPKVENDDHAQEDAHEFLRYLMEAITKAYLSGCETNNNFKVHTKMTTPIHQIFGGEFQIVSKCTSCDHQISTLQYFEDVQLDIENATTIQDSLQSFYALELLEDYACDGCHRRGTTEKQNFLHHAPISLCFQLKRFKSQYQKIDNNIKIEKELDLTRYLSLESNSRNGLKYKLVSIVSHIGSTASCGHYKAIITRNEREYVFDDATVYEVSNRDSDKKNEAYIAFYEVECSNSPTAKKGDMDEIQKDSLAAMCRPPCTFQIDDGILNMEEQCHLILHQYQNYEVPPLISPLPNSPLTHKKTNSKLQSWPTELEENHLKDLNKFTQQEYHSAEKISSEGLKRALYDTLPTLKAVSQTQHPKHVKKNGRNENQFTESFASSPSSANSDSTVGFFKQQSKGDKREKSHKRGPRSSVPLHKLHSQFNKFSNKIVIDGALVKPSESRIYQEISSRFDNYKAQAVYQAAKRFFHKRIPNLNLKTTYENECSKNDHLIFDDDPLYSLREMKYTEPYRNSMGDIGMDPFDCYFGTPYQKEFLKRETNRKKIILSFGASGVPVNITKTSSCRLQHEIYKPIFLYVIMYQGGPGQNVPVYQVLSERQDATNIRFLLSTWKERDLGRKHPDEVITDTSAALVLASVKAFTNCYTMPEYDDMCYVALFSDSTRPATYIRLDQAHIIHSMFGILKDLDSNKKRFYSRIFMVLLLCEDINEAKTLIENMFIVLLNRYQYDEVVINAIKFLTEVTRIFPSEMMNDDEKSMKNVILTVEDSKNVMKRKEETSFFYWVENLAYGVKKQKKFFHCVESTVDKLTIELTMDINSLDEEPILYMDENPLYADKLEKDLTVFLSKIHLWSNVMMKCFGSTNKTPTSACSKEPFNILKNVILTNEKKLRVDVFVRRYIDVLEGSSIKSIAKLNANDILLQHTSDDDTVGSPVELDNSIEKQPNLDKNSNKKRRNEINLVEIPTISDSHKSKRTKNTEGQRTDTFLTEESNATDDFCTEQHRTENIYSLSGDGKALCGVFDTVNDDYSISESQERNKNLYIKTNAPSRRCEKTIKNSTTLRVFTNSNLRKKEPGCHQLTHNTCSFDAIFQLYAVCYLDSTIFKAYADKNSSSDFMVLVKSFCDWDDMDNLLVAREKLLYSTFEEKIKINRRILELDCYMSVIDMFIGLSKRNNALYSITEENWCPSCSSLFRKIRINIPLMCFDLDLTNVGLSVQFRKPKKCKSCDIDMETTRKFSPVVILDLDGMRNPKTSIDKIQKILQLDGKDYHLCGLIETTGNHFIAHALRHNGLWYSYDDLRPTEMDETPDARILHPVFLLYCLLPSTSINDRANFTKPVLRSANKSNK